MRGREEGWRERGERREGERERGRERDSENQTIKRGSQLKRTAKRVTVKSYNASTSYMYVVIVTIM